MPHSVPAPRHSPFLDALATCAEATPAWCAASAGFLVLRLVDAAVPAPLGPGTWEVQAARRAVDELAPDTPHRAPLTAVLASVQSPGDPIALWDRLIAYGRALEATADYAMALDVYDSVLARATFAGAPDTVLLAQYRRATVCCTTGQWEEAEQHYAAVASLAAQHHDRSTLGRTQIGLARVAFGRGNLQASAALADQVIAAYADLPEVHSVALHQRAVLAGEAGDHARAIRLTYTALQHPIDAIDRDRLLHNLGIGFLRLGFWQVARDAFMVLSWQAQDAFTRHAALIALLEVAGYERDALRVAHLEQQIQPLELDPRHEVEFYLHLGKAHRLLGHEVRGQAALATALARAEQYRLAALMFEVEGAQHEPVTHPVHGPALLDDAVAEVAEAIGAMRESALAAV